MLLQNTRLIFPVSLDCSLYYHTCCHRDHPPSLLSQPCPTCLQIFFLPSFIFLYISCEVLEFPRSCASAKHFACALYHHLIILLIQSKSHSHTATSITSFILTPIYISHPSVLKSDLSYTDLSYFFKFLLRSLIFELYFLRNVGKIHEEQMPIKIKPIKPDKTREFHHSVVSILVINL